MDGDGFALGQLGREMLREMGVRLLAVARRQHLAVRVGEEREQCAGSMRGFFNRSTNYWSILSKLLRSIALRIDQARAVPKTPASPGVVLDFLLEAYRSHVRSSTSPDFTFPKHG